MAHDYYLPEYLRNRIGLLPKSEQRVLADCFERLMQDPEPDGFSKSPLPPLFPYPPGHIRTRCGGYEVRYYFVEPDHSVVGIAYVHPLPKAPENYDDWPAIDLGDDKDNGEVD